MCERRSRSHGSWPRTRPAERGANASPTGCTHAAPSDWRRRAPRRDAQGRADDGVLQQRALEKGLGGMARTGAANPGRAPVKPWPGSKETRARRASHALMYFASWEMTTNRGRRCPGWLDPGRSGASGRSENEPVGRFSIRSYRQSAADGRRHRQDAGVRHARAAVSRSNCVIFEPLGNRPAAYA